MGARTKKPYGNERDDGATADGGNGGDGGRREGERGKRRGREKQTNKHVDRTGRSKGEVNTASGDSARFPSGLLRLPSWDEGKAVEKGIPEVSA